MSQLTTNFYHSPIGWIKLCAEKEALRSLTFTETPEIEENNPSDSFFQKCHEQLSHYFAGTSQTIQLPITFSGTDFQQVVWRELQNVKFGETISYDSLSKRIGNPKAIRAVANANACNPLLLIVPCHRIIGKNGSLTGYSGELWRKQWLLEHETKMSGKQLNLF